MMYDDGPPPPQYNDIVSPRKGNNCLKGICCCYCILFMIILFITAVLIYVYTFYKPAAPSYKILDFTLASFKGTPAIIGANYHIMSKVVVTVEATNPDSHISLGYEKNSSVLVRYKGTLLCSGSLPSFHQGHKNVTTFKVYMSGDSTLDSKTQESLMEDDSKARIPLDIDVMVSMKIFLGNDFKLKDINVKLTCQMDVDHLTPDKKPKILKATYSYNVDF